MTSEQDAINNVVDTLGSTVVWNAYSSQVLNKWGDAERSYASDVNVTAVPYSYVFKNTQFKPFADVQHGDVIMVFKHDQDLNELDKITYDGKVRLIRRIEKYPYKNANLAKIALLVDEQ